MSNPYEVCLVGGHAESATTLARCLSDQNAFERELHSDSMVASEPGVVLPFAIFAASLVLFMQAGFAMICAGSVRKKNVQNTTLKNLLDLCGAAVSFYSVGYAFTFGDSNNSSSDITFIGTGNFLLLGMTDDESGMEYSHWLFHFAFAATSGKTSKSPFLTFFYNSCLVLIINNFIPLATIVAGTLAERCMMNAYLMYSVILTGFGKC